MLAPREPSVGERVEHALESPEAFIKKHSKSLAERAIDKPRPDLGWVALIDALAAKKLLVEIDHRSFPDDVASAIDKLASLPKQRGRFAAALKSADDDTDTLTFLRTIDETLATEKLSIVVLDMKSDSYPVVVIASPDVERAKTLASRAGYAIESIPAPKTKQPKNKTAPPSAVAVREAQWMPHIRARAGSDVVDAWAIKVSPELIEIGTSVLGGPETGTSIKPAKGRAKVEAQRMIEAKLAEGYRAVALAEYRKMDKAAAQRSKKR